MAPATGTALIVLAVFVLPGFVTLLIRERTFVLPGQYSPFERLLSALYYSAILYAFALVGGCLLGLDKMDLSEFYRGEKSLSEDLAAAAVIALLLPITLSYSALRWNKSGARQRLLTRLDVNPFHGVESAWDRAFASNGRAFVRIRLKERGDWVGGFFGRDSFASFSDHGRDVFLEQRWALDEDQWFSAPLATSGGLWVDAERIESIEFFEEPK
jgi:uncharacterized protein DUF6338